MSVEKVDRTVKWMRRVARVLSLLILGIALVITIGHLVAPEPTESDYPPIENLLPVVMIVSVLGLGLAWRWEGIGARVTLGFFVLHLALFWAICGRFFPPSMLLIFSPVFFTGLLFLACWWRSRGSQKAV